MASKAFVVPVDKKYSLELSFEFESVAARLSDKIAGSRFDENCSGEVRYEEIPESRRVGLGRPMPFKVVVRRAADRSIVLERTFVSLCITSQDLANKKTRTIGWLELQRGEYVAEITNLQAQPGLEGVKIQISLVAGHGK